jgi:hypothetical protein
MRGMTLVAELELTSSYPYLTPLLGSSPVAIHGVVSEPQLPQMTLQTAPIPAKLGTVELALVSMTFTLGDLADAGEQPISFASATLQASILLGQNVRGIVTAVLPTTSSTLALDVVFENANLGDLTLLAPFIADADPLASLPSEVSGALKSAGSAFQLASLGLVFDVQAMRFLSTDIVVRVDLKGFGPFSALPLLKVDGLTIEWCIDTATSPAATTFSATAEIELPPACPVILGFQTQPGGDYLIVLRQNTGSTLKLSELVTIFLPGLTLPELDVSDLAMTLAPRDDFYTFSATIDGSWTVLESLGLELATVTVDALYSGSATPSLSGSVAGVLGLEIDRGSAVAAAAAALSEDPGTEPPPAVIDLELSATRPAGVDGWLFMGQTGVNQIVPVGDLIAALVRKFDVPASVPASIATLTIENLGLRFDTVSENFTFACQVDVEIEGEPVEVVVNASITKTGTGHEMSFGGTILVGSLEFDLFFDESNASTSLVAVYTHKPGDPEQIALRDLVEEISPTVGAQVPADIEIQLDGVKLVVVKQGEATEFAFSLDLSLSFGLSDLPLVGHALPSESVSIEHLQLMYSTAQLTSTEATDVNGRLPSSVAPLPTAGLSPGAGVTATILLEGVATPIAFGIPSSAATGGATTTSASDSLSLISSPAPSTSVTAAPASQPTAHWFDVHKTFGPVSIARVGVQYQDSALLFLIDASMSMAALTVGLDGLGLGSRLTSFSPLVHLDGLSISFTDGPVSIDGGFLAVSSPPANVTDEYMGELTIAIEPYLISGVGAYAKVNGHVSFFVFAEIDGEFGGPPAFFVTGFMGGVGYNWALTLPPADQVYTFPFVAGLGDPSFFGGAHPTPVQVLDALSGHGGKPAWVVPSDGENWIAAGIQFRSFELVLGRALLVAEFGKDFELALLGLATVTLPQEADKDAYAYAELQLEVVLKPDDGVFSAIASLTPNSYLLTRQCHLTGGFAFCLWFGSNPHAGDFVLTIGGYHPAFEPPVWYPVVPRLGFNWAVDNDIAINGGVYFAITPTAAMAGGKLEVLFESGDLKAWLTAYANIMIRWRPFYVTAGVGISVGVSYKLDLLFTSVTLSVELGATLELWGPPTGGVVHVDWYIISFSISFGANPASAKDLTLDWTGFEMLLPSTATNTQTATRRSSSFAPAGATGQQPVILSLAVSRGLSHIDSVSGDWIVRADELVLTSNSAVPITSIAFGSVSLVLPKDAPSTIDIRPMGLGDVTSTHTITITPVDADRSAPLAADSGSGLPLALTDWPTPTVLSASLPEALWGTPIANTHAPAPAAKLIGPLPTGLSFSPPAASAGNAVGPLDPDSLVTKLGTGIMPLTPATQSDPIAQPVVDTGSIAAIAADVASQASVTAQQNLVAALTGYGAAPPTSAPLVELGRQAGAVFSQPPMRSA